MMMLDTLRALAGIVGHTGMDDEIKEQAKKMMIKIMTNLDKDIDIQAHMMKKASAEMNGIIS